MVILSILFLALNLPLTYYRTPGKSFLVIASYDFSPEFLLEIVISSFVALLLVHPNRVILVKTVSKVGMWSSKANQNSSLGFEKKKLELFSSLLSGKYYEDGFSKIVMTYPKPCIEEEKTRPSCRQRHGYKMGKCVLWLSQPWFWLLEVWQITSSFDSLRHFSVFNKVPI